MHSATGLFSTKYGVLLSSPMRCIWKKNKFAIRFFPYNTVFFSRSAYKQGHLTLGKLQM